MYRSTALAFALLGVGAVAGLASELSVAGTASPAIQGSFETPKNWRQPATPFQIADHSWYVGMEGLSIVLIKTLAGAVVIDAGLPNSGEAILAQIKKVGVAPTEVKWLLHSHAHNDHVGSLAELYQATGARLATNAESAALLARGGLNDIHFGDKAPYPAVQADQLLMNGEKIQIGDLNLTPHFTPGHTPGGISWTWTDQRHGKPIRIAFIDSLTAPGYRLHNNPRYPYLVEDFTGTINTVSNLPCDLLLTPYPEASGWDPTNTKNPHTHPITCKAYADKTKRRLADQLRSERKLSKSPG